MTETVATARARRSRAVAVLVATIGVIGLLGGFRRAEVTGSSMAPTMLPGDRILLRRRRGSGQLRLGTIVAVDDPRPDRTQLLVKRVAAVRGAEVTLLGDNLSASTDSRDFGPVELSRIHWVFVRRYGRLDASA